MQALGHLITEIRKQLTSMRDKRAAATTRCLSCHLPRQQAAPEERTVMGYDGKAFLGVTWCLHWEPRGVNSRLEHYVRRVPLRMTAGLFDDVDPAAPIADLGGTRDSSDVASHEAAFRTLLLATLAHHAVCAARWPDGVYVGKPRRVSSWPSLFGNGQIGC